MNIENILVHGHAGLIDGVMHVREGSRVILTEMDGTQTVMPSGSSTRFEKQITIKRIIMANDDARFSTDYTGAVIQNAKGKAVPTVVVDKDHPAGQMGRIIFLSMGKQHLLNVGFKSQAVSRFSTCQAEFRQAFGVAPILVPDRTPFSPPTREHEMPCMVDFVHKESEERFPCPVPRVDLPKMNQVMNRWFIGFQIEMHVV